MLRLNEFLKSGRLPQPQGGVAVTLNGGVPQLTTPASIVRTPPNNRNEQPLFFDPGVTTPCMEQLIVGLQHEVWKDTVVDISYVGSRGPRSDDEREHDGSGGERVHPGLHRGAPQRHQRQ